MKILWWRPRPWDVMMTMVWPVGNSLGMLTWWGVRYREHWESDRVFFQRVLEDAQTEYCPPDTKANVYLWQATKSKRGSVR